MSDGGRVKAAWGAKVGMDGLVGKRRRARVQVLDSGKIAGVIELGTSLPERNGWRFPATSETGIAKRSADDIKK